MYHIYEIETQNEGIDWHVYAQNLEDAYLIMASFNDSISQECRDLARVLHYPSISSELRSGAGFSYEIQEIRNFFARFYIPQTRHTGAKGGYALDYRKCSVNEEIEMPYDIMLDYLDMIETGRFFLLDNIQPVYAGGKEINIPDYDSDMKLTLAISTQYGYENEALIESAGAKLGFLTDRGQKNKDSGKDIFSIELKGIIQLCQLLNFLPPTGIHAVSFS